MVGTNAVDIGWLTDRSLYNEVAWMGLGAKILKMEELVHAVENLDTDDAEEYFSSTLKYCGIKTLPNDWRERIRIGSDRKQSGTARENLAGPASNVPDELPAEQKKLVDFAVPGLRRILGYA